MKIPDYIYKGDGPSFDAMPSKLSSFKSGNVYRNEVIDECIATIKTMQSIDDFDKEFIIDALRKLKA